MKTTLSWIMLVTVCACAARAPNSNPIRIRMSATATVGTPYFICGYGPRLPEWTVVSVKVNGELRLSSGVSDRQYWCVSFTPTAVEWYYPGPRSFESRYSAENSDPYADTTGEDPVLAIEAVLANLDGPLATAKRSVRLSCPMCTPLRGAR